MKHFFDSVVSVVTVKDYAAARAWYIVEEVAEG